jgi:uncharacterized membrane protein YeaQ/YmgE (transglycosylase-associated protein family)
MGFFSWILMGLVAGALAKWILPGKDPGGIFITMLIGIAGGLLGGLIGSTLFGIGMSFSLSGLVLAIGGALILLAGYRTVKKKE